jgi:anti-sigma regulatory factor (Ser/Thr protein kinase)
VEAGRKRSASGGTARLEFRVPVAPKMVSEVRRAIGELPLPAPLLDDARLLATELVTNCIRHAGLRPDDLIRVRAQLSGPRLRVDVIQGDRRGTPHPVAGAIRPAPGAESGWGLYLVERIATRWGYGRGRYWFELEQGSMRSRGSLSS